MRIIHAHMHPAQNVTHHEYCYSAPWFLTYHAPRQRAHGSCRIFTCSLSIASEHQLIIMTENPVQWSDCWIFLFFPISRFSWVYYDDLVFRSTWDLWWSWWDNLLLMSIFLSKFMRESLLGAESVKMSHSSSIFHKPNQSMRFLYFQQATVVKAHTPHRRATTHQLASSRQLIIPTTPK